MLFPEEVDNVSGTYLADILNRKKSVSIGTHQLIDILKLPGQNHCGILSHFPDAESIYEPVKRSGAAVVDAGKDFNGSLGDQECIKLIGISRNTYYKYKRELRYEDQ